MSHELRTPLNAIIGFAELIRTETMGPVGTRTYCEYAKDIHDSGHHLLSLINDVLDLSKIEADRMVLDEETVDLNAVVATCIRMSRTQAMRGGVSLVAEIDPAAALVRGEQRRLMQVALNLVSNAIKYTKQGGSVTITTQMHPDGSLELSVRDTGCGIADHDLAIVMQPFGQIDNPYNRINQGTGLGLPLARRLVELHDGRLLLESRVGIGTTATVMLPADRVIDPVAWGRVLKPSQSRLPVQESKHAIDEPIRLFGMKPVSGTGDDLDPHLREQAVDFVVMACPHIIRPLAGHEQRRLIERPAGEIAGREAGDLVHAIAQRRQIDPPGKGAVLGHEVLKQEASDRRFRDSGGQLRIDLAAPGDSGQIDRPHRLDIRDHRVPVCYRCDIGDDQLVHQFRMQQRSVMAALPPMLWPSTDACPSPLSSI